MQHRPNATVIPMQQIFTDSQIRDLARQSRKSVTEWILNCNVRTGKEWKQILRNRFVYLTQFTNQGGRNQFWQKDLHKAAQQTVTQICPDWQNSNDSDRATHTEIQDRVKKLIESKKSPRQDWLFQTAYFWLKSLDAETQNSIWYPQQAIPMAHAIFASSGKFRSFMNYMKRDLRRRQPPINQLIEAYESINRLPFGTSYCVASMAQVPLSPPPDITTAQYPPSQVVEHPSRSAKAPSKKH